MLRIYLSDAENRQTLNILDDPHTFHCDSYFVFGGIRLHSCLEGDSNLVPVDFFELLSTEFTAWSKPPSGDNCRNAFYPRTQQRDLGTV